MNSHKDAKALRKDVEEKFDPLSEKEEAIATKIVDAAYTVHRKLGPGLLEKVYEVCFCHELAKRGLQFRRQVDLPIICELKAVDELNPVWEAQLLSHLKLTEKRLGFLISAIGGSASG